MIEAFWYGTAAALAFIGLLFLICLVILHIYRAKNSAYIIFIDETTDRGEIPNLIYSAHLRSIIFGSLLCGGVTVVAGELSEENRQLVYETAAKYSGMTVCTAEEFLCRNAGKEKNGSGA